MFRSQTHTLKTEPQFKNVQSTYSSWGTLTVFRQWFHNEFCWINLAHPSPLKGSSNQGKLSTLVADGTFCLESNCIMDVFMTITASYGKPEWHNYDNAACSEVFTGSGACFMSTMMKQKTSQWNKFWQSFSISLANSTAALFWRRYFDVVGLWDSTVSCSLRQLKSGH